MVYSVVFEHKLNNATIYGAYDTIQDWVREQRGKVKENRRPNLIIVHHGSSSKKKIAWEKNAMKTMRFELTQHGEEVLVKVHVSSSSIKDSDAASHGDTARFNWNQLLASLWARFGDTDAEKEALASIPTSWTRSLETGKKMRLVGGAITGVGYILVLFSPTLIAVAVSAIGIIIMVNGTMKVRSAKKNLPVTTKRR